MNIVYASDDNYAEIAGISILSLCENNREAPEVNIFYIDNGVTDENKKRLLGIVEPYGRRLTFIDMIDIEGLAGSKINVSTLSLATFSRLFLASLLPADVDRCIYIDCDTMVRASLFPLWDEDFEGNLVAGVYDYTDNFNKRNIFLKTKDLYINAGIMLIDLKRWRELHVERYFINFIKLLKGRVHFVDQGVINAALNRKIKLIHPKYNCCYVYYIVKNENFMRRARRRKIYSEQMTKEASENPTIIHFASMTMRSLIAGNEYLWLKEEYIKYMNMAPWANIPGRDSLAGKKVEISKSVKMKIKIVGLLPPPLYKLLYVVLYKGGANYLHSRKCLITSEIRLEDCRVKNI